MKRDPLDDPWATVGANALLVELVSHRPEWAVLFRREAERIARACGELVPTLEHIGSTAVPGLIAKPILDMMPGIVRLEDGPLTIGPMESIGYSCKGEHGIPGRLYFEMHRHGLRVVHAHMFVIGTEDWERHLLFRDYLRDHPDTAREYAEPEDGAGSALPKRSPLVHGRQDRFHPLDRRVRAEGPRVRDRARAARLAALALDEARDGRRRSRSSPEERRRRRFGSRSFAPGRR